MGSSLTVKGTISGRVCNFILDIGATKSIFNPNMVNDLKYLENKYRNFGYTLRTSTVEYVPVIGEIELEVKFGRNKVQMKY